MKAAARVLTLPAAEAATLGELRLLDGIDVAENAGVIWVRVTSASQVTDDILLKIPAIERRLLSGDGKLYRLGHRLAEGPLPPLEWTPLREWLKVAAPKVALPAKLDALASLSLIRGGGMKEAQLLMIPLRLFASHVSVTAEARLERWRFAVSGDACAVVQGAPIPSLPGQRFSIENGIAVPLGQRWEPEVSAAVLARLFKLEAGDLLLWESDELRRIINSEQWLPVSRASVRATLEAMV